MVPFALGEFQSLAEVIFILGENVVEVRNYQPNDYVQLIELYKNKMSYGGNYDSLRDTESRLKATTEQGDLYVAIESSKVVGTFMILDNPHSFWLLRFAVDPTLKNYLEIGAELAKKANAVAKERGHSSIIVYTDMNDESLNDRYIKLGFNAADDYKCYWKEVS